RAAELIYDGRPRIVLLAERRLREPARPRAEKLIPDVLRRGDLHRHGVVYRQVENVLDLEKVEQIVRHGDGAMADEVSANPERHLERGDGETAKVLNRLAMNLLLVEILRQSHGEGRLHRLLAASGEQVYESKQLLGD